MCGYCCLPSSPFNLRLTPWPHPLQLEPLLNSPHVRTVTIWDFPVGTQLCSSLSMAMVCDMMMNMRMEWGNTPFLPPSWKPLTIPITTTFSRNHPWGRPYVLGKVNGGIEKDNKSLLLLCSSPPVGSAPFLVFVSPVGALSSVDPAPLKWIFCIFYASLWKSILVPTSYSYSYSWTTLIHALHLDLLWTWVFWVLNLLYMLPFVSLPLLSDSYQFGFSKKREKFLLLHPSYTVLDYQG